MVASRTTLPRAFGAYEPLTRSVTDAVWRSTVGLGVGVGDGVGKAEGLGVGLGVTLGLGDGVGEAEGLGVGLGLGVGVGVEVGAGVEEAPVPLEPLVLDPPTLEPDVPLALELSPLEELPELLFELLELFALVVLRASVVAPATCPAFVASSGAPPKSSSWPCLTAKAKDSCAWETRAL